MKPLILIILCFFLAARVSSAQTPLVKDPKQLKQALVEAAPNAQIQIRESTVRVNYKAHKTHTPISSDPTEMGIALEVQKDGWMIHLSEAVPGSPFTYPSVLELTPPDSEPGMKLRTAVVAGIKVEVYFEKNTDLQWVRNVYLMLRKGMPQLPNLAEAPKL